MGEKQNQPFQISFNTSLRVALQGSRVTFDGGLLVVRELDERLGLSALIAENIRDGYRLDSILKVKKEIPVYWTLEREK
jgi:hypothetical protein